MLKLTWAVSYGSPSGLLIGVKHPALPPRRDISPSSQGSSLSEHWKKGWAKYCYKHGGASFREPVPFPIRDGIPESMLVFDVETMPKEGHPYPDIAIAA